MLHAFGGPGQPVPYTPLGASAYGNPFLWTGQRSDPRFALYHFLYRTYDPNLGRWMQRDMVGVLASTQQIDWNGQRSSIAIGSPNKIEPGAEFHDALSVFVYLMSSPIVGTDAYGLGFWNGSNWFHAWVAEVFWMNLHSAETLAEMSNARAVTEAVGISVVVGAGGYFAATYGIAYAKGQADWVALRVGAARVGSHVGVGSSSSGWIQFVGTPAFMTATAAAANFGRHLLFLSAWRPHVLEQVLEAWLLRYNSLEGALWS